MMLKISGLEKYYNKNKSNELHVLKNINIELPKSGMVAVFGKSGCGKTTLLNMIGGLDNRDRGQVEIDGERISSNNDLVRNKYIGYIFQNYYLNPKETCFDNVANALKLCGVRDKEVIEKRVIAALKNVGMDKYRKRTPDTLSGGQMQRIAIARAIVKNPQVLLADEPTGNLDSENTVMIMDLLKEISKDHLVVLVTHEQKLVDYYCDKVIELHDGKITNIYNNENVFGYNEKPANDIYLGELESVKLTEGFVNLEYFGEKTEEPIYIKIVSYEGKLYLKVDNNKKIQLVDDGSEIKLKNGVFENRRLAKNEYKNIDMSELPHIEGKSYGKLMTFKESLVSGFKSCFAPKKKGKKLLSFCMTAFAISIVFTFAFFGVAIKDYQEVKSKIVDGVFYVYSQDNRVTERIFSWTKENNSIVDLMLTFSNPVFGDDFSYSKIQFESSADKNNLFYEDTNYDVTYLSTETIDKNAIYYGRISDLQDNEIVITTYLADKIIRDAAVEYISSYDNVINLKDKKGNTIVGIVSSDKAVVYFSKVALANHNIYNHSNYPVKTDDEINIDLSKGEILLYTYENPFEYKRGDIFKINGIEFNVKNVITKGSYLEWCRMKGYEFETNPEQYFKNKVNKDFPDLDETRQAYWDHLEEYTNKYCFNFYEDFYMYLDEYMIDMSSISTDYYYWLYSVKNIDHAKYMYLDTVYKDRYYSAVLYKEKFGSFPTRDFFVDNTSYLTTIDDLERSLSIYIPEYTNYDMDYQSFFVVLDKDDFVSVSNSNGESSEFESKFTFYRTNEDSKNDFSFWNSDFTYYKIVCSDENKTLELIEDIKTILPENDGDKWYLVTTSDIYTSNTSEILSKIVSNLLYLSIFMVLMSICIFLIMRSSIMLRIREIGIYRAVGMSKKNIVMKFFAESLSLTTVSIIPGFIISSVLISIWIKQAPLVREMFYYNFPMAMILLVFIYVLCTVAGVLPIITLLRKTPSTILSKYDI